MNKLSTLLFFIHIVYTSFAQTQISFSETQAMDVRSIKSAAQLKNNTLQILRAAKKGVYFIETYNLQNLKKTNSITFTTKKGSNNQLEFTPIDLVQLNNNNYLIVSAFFKREQKIIIGLQPLDSIGNNTGVITQLAKFDVSEQKEYMPFSVSVSEDHNQLVVVAPYKFIISKSDENETKIEKRYYADVVTLNNQQQSLSYYKLSSELEARWTKCGKITISNKGQVFLPLYEERNTHWRPSTIEERKLIFFISDKSKFSFQSLNILPSDYEYGTFQYRYNTLLDKVEFWGTYANIKSKFGGEDAIGLFKIIVNPYQFTIESKILQPFQNDLIALVNNKTKVNKNIGIPRNYRLLETAEMKNNNWLIFEFIDYVDPRVVEENYGIHVNYEQLNYNAIIALKIDDHCNVLHYTFIPKYHSALNRNQLFGSFVSVTANDKLMLFFNDHIKNTKVNSEKRHKVIPMYNILRTGLFMVSISPEGIVNKSLIKENRKGKQLVMPSKLLTAKDYFIGQFAENQFSDESMDNIIGIFKLNY